MGALSCGPLTLLVYSRHTVTTSPSKPPKRRSIKAEVKLLSQCGDFYGLSATARHVLLVLYSYTDENGWCYPSNSLLERDTGLSERTIRKVLGELDASGIVPAYRPPPEPSGARGRLAVGNAKLRRGQAIYLVWPTASPTGRSTLARLRNPDGQPLNAATRGWYLLDELARPLGPYSTADVAELIRAGEIYPSTQIWTEGTEWSRAVDLAIFAAHFSTAG